MGPDEWKGLPWHLRDTYMDGLRLEGILKNDEEPDGQEDAATSNTSAERDPLGSTGKDFENIGLTVVDDDEDWT